ncbi:MAG: sialate O-acetylesterase [Akkermansiaceae bacterium]|nr:sialate O-acetylesterase [Akkermansiaceae bacterium]
MKALIAPIPRLAAVLGLLALLPAATAQDEKPAPAIELGAPFADSAILQQGQDVPVWGWSEPGTEVTVEFAGQKKSAKAGEDGKWMVQLDPLEVNAEPAEMTISEKGGKSVTLKDILVGEVWMASGQSNMQWILGKSAGRELAKELSQMEQKDQPLIREFKVTNYYAHLHPIEHAEGEWGKDYSQFSAIAFAFAHKLYGELKVPIGILNCSFSQTAIEAWTPRIGYQGSKSEYNQAIEAKLLETDPSTPEHQAAWDAFYQQVMEVVDHNQKVADEDENQFLDLPKNLPGNMRGNRDATWLYNARLHPVVPYAIKGCIWNQGYANMGGGITYYTNLHAMIRGWRLAWDRPELPVYFHQFYSPGNEVNKGPNHPDIGTTAEMRLGTWLARDIPHTGMASQIDIQGAIHYGHKIVPGQRLALHALKNQYGKDVVTDGPMFRKYEVKGDEVVVSFYNAEGGLVVADTAYNAIGRHEDSTGFADPKVIENGADQVTLFYVAGEDRVWHPAKVRIEGEKAIVSSDAVKEPRGVTYGTGGVGFQPSIYNEALLPLTPFIVYEEKLVTNDSWPDKPIKIAGVELDPSSVGLVYDYRKFPVLSTQFRDNCVLQAGQPVTIWGAAARMYYPHAEGKKVIHFSFNGIEKEIPLTDEMIVWKVTVPAMEASAEPKTIKASLSIDGEVVHERVAENVVVGDVWYVAGTRDLKMKKEAAVDGPIRIMARMAKGVKNKHERPYSVATSTTPKNRFASYWGEPESQDAFAAKLAAAIHEKTGKPVGIIYMDDMGNELKHWMDVPSLANAPSLKEDYEDIAAITPGTPFYKQNAERYVDAWKSYWDDYITEMIVTKAVPDAAPWGSYPEFSGSVETDATWVYNCLIASFRRTQVKGIVFMTEESMVKGDGADFAGELSALANGWKRLFKGEKDPHFIYSIPSKELAPKISRPEGIEGSSAAYEVDAWPNFDRKKVDRKQWDELDKKGIESVEGLIDTVIETAY